MARTKGILAMLALALCPLDAAAQPLVLTLSPDKTSVAFTVAATGHVIEGLLALDAGEIHFDPETGAASGQVTIDMRRAATGNRLRDHEMHANVLESQQYPIATFRPNRITGAFVSAGSSQLVLAGVLSLHGAEHSMTLPIRVRVEGETVSAEAVFEVPYVAWGLRDPSFLFLRVAPIAAVTLKADVNLHADETAAR
jgi:polyisoprenoid-binding protein YceI